MPDEHDGSSEFTFDLEFSQNVEAGYKRIRDKAGTISGGRINQAKRKTQGSNQSWTIRVPDPPERATSRSRCPRPPTATTPAPSAPPTGGCSTTRRRTPSGARSGSRSPTPKSRKGDGAALAFAVALSRAASSQSDDRLCDVGRNRSRGRGLHVNQRNTDDRRGKLLGIEVAVIDDEHNEGSESLTLTLSNASSGDITDASATGTITNHDPLPKALAARFSRTAAMHVVEQVEERVNAPRSPGWTAASPGAKSTSDVVATSGICGRLNPGPKTRKSSAKSDGSSVACRNRPKAPGLTAGRGLQLIPKQL